MEVASPALKAYLLLKLLNGLRRGDLLRLSLESLPANGIHVRMSKTGACYVSLQKTASGFDSLWRRFMSKVLRGTSIRERFQEKDLRKKTASDMTLQSAQSLLGHAAAETTRRHYRLRGEYVDPHTLPNSFMEIPELNAARSGPAGGRRPRRDLEEN